MTTTNGYCGRCGGFGCDVRAARGLKRFCEIEVVATPARPEPTREELQAQCKPGQGVVAVRSGMGHGPRRYIIVGKAVA